MYVIFMYIIELNNLNPMKITMVDWGGKELQKFHIHCIFHDIPSV